MAGAKAATMRVEVGRRRGKVKVVKREAREARRDALREAREAQRDALREARMARGARVPRPGRRGLLPQPSLRRPLPLRRCLPCPRWGPSPNPSASAGRVWSKNQ